MRLRALLLCCVVGLAALPVRAEEPTGSLNPAAADDDLACAHAPAGSVLAVPPPLDRWVVLVCAPQSQALVPVEGMVWVTHGTMDPVSILALPPGATQVPKTREYDPRYGVRFKALLAADAKGKKLDHARALIKAALTGEPMPRFDRVIQLDAVSIIYDMRYNIYFYIDGQRPRTAIACIDECRQALVMDVLTTDEMKARVAGVAR